MVLFSREPLGFGKKVSTHIADLKSLAKAICHIGAPLDFILCQKFESLIQLAGSNCFLPSFSLLQGYIESIKSAKSGIFDPGHILPWSEIHALLVKNTDFGLIARKYFSNLAALKSNHFQKIRATKQPVVSVTTNQTLPGCKVGTTVSASTPSAPANTTACPQQAPDKLNITKNEVVSLICEYYFHSLFKNRGGFNHGPRAHAARNYPIPPVSYTPPAPIPVPENGFPLSPFALTSPSSGSFVQITSTMCLFGTPAAVKRSRSSLDDVNNKKSRTTGPISSHSSSSEKGSSSKYKKILPSPQNIQHMQRPSSSQHVPTHNTNTSIKRPAPDSVIAEMKKKKRASPYSIRRLKLLEEMPTSPPPQLSTSSIPALVDDLTDSSSDRSSFGSNQSLATIFDYTPTPSSSRQQPLSSEWDNTKKA